VKQTIAGGLTAFAVAGLALSAARAQAGIQCDGPYHIVRGQAIAAPYCEDNYLASVARQYGMRVSGRTIRASFSTKERVCRFIGHDNRVSQICAGFRPDGRDRRAF